MYSFPNLEPVCCSMFSSNCCFLTCIHISLEAGKVVWSSHLFKNFPQFVLIHTVKSFGIVNKAVDVFLELPCFLYDPADVGNLISGSSTFSKPSLYIWKFSVHVLLKPILLTKHHFKGPYNQSYGFSSRHEFEQTLRVREEQGGLACCHPCGCKESDVT